MKLWTLQHHNLAIGAPIQKVTIPWAQTDAGAWRTAYRWMAEQAEASALNPVRLGLSALNAFDRLNDRHPTGFDRSYLITALKIRKPERPA